MINSAVGGPAANSYVSVEYADSFFAASVGNSAWPPQLQLKEAALIDATRILDSQFDWVGSIAQESQSVRWPRIGVYDADNRLIASDAIPKSIMDATCHLAYYMIQNGGLNQSERDIKGVKIGPIDLKFSDKSTIGMPRYLIKALQVFGTYTGAIQGSAYSVNVLRS